MLYFQSLPLITYDLTGLPNVVPETIRNIFYRLKILDTIQQNTLLYYPYYVKDGETPEHIAFNYYKDSNLGWLVMLVNTVIDGQFDWPLSDMSFLNYMNKKYGSIDTASNLIDHYTMTVSKTDSASGMTTEQTVVIDQNTYNTTPGFTFQEINLQDGTTVSITTTTTIVYVLDQEHANNEAKRNISLLDKSYTSQIQQEFVSLTAKARSGQ